MNVDLVFRGAPLTAPPIHLVFGDDGSGPPAADADISFAIALPALRLAASFNVDADIPSYIGASSGLPWRAGNWAPRRADASWRDGDIAHPTAGASWRDGVRAATPATWSWQDGIPMAEADDWPWRDGVPLSGRPAPVPWRQAIPLEPTNFSTYWRSAIWLDPARTGLAWGQGIFLRLPHGLPWQQGVWLPRLFPLAWQQGAPHLGAVGLPWQDSIFLASYGGPLRVVPVEPPGEHCYEPRNPVHLLFARAWSGSPHLVFACDGHDAVGGATSIIPLLRVYMTTHNISVLRMPDGLPLHFNSFSISADEGEFGWSLNATGAAALLDLLAPAAGAPARVRVTVDGMAWEFVVDRLQRTRALADSGASLTGRSVTALLGAPYLPVGTWANSAPATAQQVAETALEFTGTSLDWRITDWLLPAGAWRFQGTPLQAVQRVAEAAGAVVQSHRTDAQLILLPRYPALPWAWGAATPDVQLPLQAVVRDSWERADRPAYNGVYVSGEGQGISAWVKREGSDGAALAGLVVDSLILDEVVARQRGGSILGGGGPQARVVIDLPVLTSAGQPGVIDVGKLVEVNEPAETWRGLVRSVSMRCDWPVVRQAVALERHL